MSENLSQFLVDLSTDPARMAAFLADTDRVFEEAGLTAEEQAVLRSRDPRLMSRTLGASMQLNGGNETNDSAKKTSKKRKTSKKKKGTKKKAGKKR